MSYLNDEHKLLSFLSKPEAFYYSIPDFLALCANRPHANATVRYERTRKIYSNCQNDFPPECCCAPIRIRSKSVN